MRVLVCGSRTFTDPKPVDLVLYGLWRPLAADLSRSMRDPLMTVIEGGAKGADALAAFWAQNHEGVDWVQMPANWQRCAAECPEHHPMDGPRGPYCPTAGLRRNERMLTKGEPDLVLAFVDKPLHTSRGTADMVRRARAAGVATYVVEAGG